MNFKFFYFYKFFFFFQIFYSSPEHPKFFFVVFFRGRDDCYMNLKRGYHKSMNSAPRLTFKTKYLALPFSRQRILHPRKRTRYFRIKQNIKYKKHKYIFYKKLKDIKNCTNSILFIKNNKL